MMTFSCLEIKDGEKKKSTYYPESASLPADPSPWTNIYLYERQDQVSKTLLNHLEVAKKKYNLFLECYAVIKITNTNVPATSLICVCVCIK